jgi:hypothetical protein
MDLSALTSLLSLLPEPARTYVGAALQASAAVVLVSSVITAHTPAWAFKKWRVLRVFSQLSAFAPRDGAGSVKVPGFAPRDPGAMEDLAKLQAFAAEMIRSGRATPEEITPPSRGTVAPPPPAGGAS